MWYGVVKNNMTKKIEIIKTEVSSPYCLYRLAKEISRSDKIDIVIYLTENVKLLYELMFKKQYSFLYFYTSRKPYSDIAVSIQKSSKKPYYVSFVFDLPSRKKVSEFIYPLVTLGYYFNSKEICTEDQIYLPVEVINEVMLETNVSFEIVEEVLDKILEYIYDNTICFKRNIKVYKTIRDLLLDFFTNLYKNIKEDKVISYISENTYINKNEVREIIKYLFKFTIDKIKKMEV